MFDYIYADRRLPADPHARMGGRRRVARAKAASNGDRLADRVAAQSQAPKAVLPPQAQLVLPMRRSRLVGITRLVPAMMRLAS